MLRTTILASRTGKAIDEHHSPKTYITMDTPVFEVDQRFRDVELELNDNIRRWLLKPTVKILIVTDGSVSLGTGGFALGRVIEMLESNKFYNWVRFKITGASRDGTAAFNPSATSTQFTYTGFRFNGPDFDLSDFDQVWFFGIKPLIHGPTPGVTDAAIENPGNNPLSDAELEILFRWMDEQQGGVFATGDHYLLGSAMAHRIPRVRNMRKWTIAQSVPPINGFDRKETNQPASYVGNIPTDGAQRDDVPQPIEVIKRKMWGGFSQSYITRFHYAPHPILCGVDGIIDVFPDHAHEGECLGRRYDGVGTQPIGLEDNLTFLDGGYSAAEYPAGTGSNPRPEPTVIAVGHPVNAAVPHAKGEKDTSPFGLVSVYDGEQAGVGRVAVDSTWHHWFNLNLEGFVDGAPHTELILNYFKNIAVWLSRSSLRNQMLSAATWNLVVINYDPMLFTPDQSIYLLGEQAKDILGRTATRCTTSQWIIDLIFPEIWDRIRIPEIDPCYTCPPFEIFEFTMLGGIIRELIPIVEDLRGSEKLQRKRLDTRAIGKSIERGLQRGASEFSNQYQRSLEYALKSAKSFDQVLRKEATASQFMVAQDMRKVRLVLERILLNHPSFNVLYDKQQLQLSVRATVLGISILKKDPVFDLDLRYVDQTAALYADPGVVLLEDAFDEGEDLTLEFFLTSAQEKVATTQKIWEQTFTNGPVNWPQQAAPDLMHLAKQESVAVWLKISN